ncbi:hypothetical protein [Bacterioplanoides sp.]|uniref:hypothetical protein n=1 Tax=Bacterioplanoides sp. TaxID=2066072 RepID=UPI003B00864D
MVVSDQYALWRTDNLNLSIRQNVNVPAGELRHLGFEDPDAREFVTSTDVNGILWEQFSFEQQAQEIAETWPDAAMMPI